MWVYSHPSRFRFIVTVEFGTPFKIGSELVQEYEKDRASAWNKFLGVIESKLREVIFTAPSYKEMSSIYLAKRLCLPTSMNNGFTKEEINDIYKKIFNFYNSHKEEPDVKQFFEEVYDYGHELKSLGVRDSHIYMSPLNSLQYLATLLVSISYLIMLLLCLSPGFITMAPLGMYARSKAEKLRIKHNGVSKTVGLDEISSSRIVTVLAKFLYFCFFIWTFTFIFQFMYADIPTFDAAKNGFYFLAGFLPYCYIWVITSDKIVGSYVEVKFLSYLLYKGRKWRN